MRGIPKQYVWQVREFGTVRVSSIQFTAGQNTGRIPKAVSSRCLLPSHGSQNILPLFEWVCLTSFRKSLKLPIMRFRIS